MSKDKEIIIRVEGGLIQSIENIPNDVTIRVWDYDTDGVDESLTEFDDHGESCVESIYKTDHGPLLPSKTNDTGHSVEGLILLDELAGEIRGIVDLLYDRVSSEADRLYCSTIEERISTIQSECYKLINKIENPNA